MNTANSSSGPGAKKFIPGIAWFFLVLFLLCLPGSDLPTVQGWLNKIYFDKWIHIGLFSILTFLFMYPFIRSSIGAKDKWHYLLRIAIAVSVFGLTSEFIQKFFILGRSFDLLDWAADSLGALIALVFCRQRLLRSK